jgi:hypothetical protein
MTISDVPNSERRAQLRAEAAVVEAAMRAAVHEALLLHKRAGQPVVTWENGNIVWTPADQIAVDDVRSAP